MSTILGPAKQFFEACETGQGWDACKALCNPDATFSSQTNALSEISTLEGYCEWMKFHGTQTGPGGPVPPTEKKIAADYVYHMVFDGERIKHMTKIWNDSVSMQQLGWD